MRPAELSTALSVQKPFRGLHRSLNVSWSGTAASRCSVRNRRRRRRRVGSERFHGIEVSLCTLGRSCDLPFNLAQIQRGRSDGFTL